MGVPANYTDYFELELQINYNNSVNQWLQAGLTSGPQPPMESQAGWNERYILNSPVAGGFPYGAAYAITQARAAVLGLNFYVKKAIGHQASVFKSSFPMPNAASLAVFDAQNTYNNTAYIQSQYCSSPQETILLRLESSNLRRWEYQIRGIKDYMSDDTMSYFVPTSYYGGTTPPNTSVFDSPAVVLPYPQLSGGTPLSITVTNTGGAISSPVLTPGGSYPGVANGQYDTIFTQPGFGGIAAVGTVSINGGQATAASVFSNLQGTGYQGTTVTIPLSNDPYGLPNYQQPSSLWANFMSCLISYTASGTTQRVSQTTFTAPVPTFPSGLVPLIVGSLAGATRAMFQRVGNRQTGQIRTTAKARVKRGI